MLHQSGAEGLSNKQPWTNSSRTYILCHSTSVELYGGRPLEPSIQRHYSPGPSAWLDGTEGHVWLSDLWSFNY